MKTKELDYIINLLKREKGYCNEYEFIIDEVIKKIKKRFAKSQQEVKK